MRFLSTLPSPFLTDMTPDLHVEQMCTALGIKRRAQLTSRLKWLKVDDMVCAGIVGIMLSV